MTNSLAPVQAWPPAYILKKHPRAKRIRFRASLCHGLEVIVPSYFNVKHLPALLDQNRAWIEKQLKDLSTRRPLEGELPVNLFFQAVNSHWKISYLTSQARLQIFSRPQQELVLMGNLQDPAGCKKKLRSWIKDFAKEHLLSLLDRISLETGLTYTKSSIRNQLTRWGSCSRQKNISLNYKLIFLPAILVRHTILHELCHTIHFNHSEHFWALLERYDPDWRENRRALRKAGHFLPTWLL